MFRRLSASLQFMCNRDINFYRSNLARIERSAQKQAKSGSGTAGWYEKWWVSFDSASYPLYLFLLDSSCVSRWWMLSNASFHVGGRSMMLKVGQRKELINMADWMINPGGRSGASIMMGEDLFLNGLLITQFFSNSNQHF